MHLTENAFAMPNGYTATPGTYSFMPCAHANSNYELRITDYE